MQMTLSMSFRILNPLLQDILRLLDKLSMQINGIRINASIGVVFSKDELGRLFVIFIHLTPVRLAFFREFFRFCAVAAFVSFPGLDSR